MKCLLLHDLQNDFFQYGSMNVPKSLDYIQKVNNLIKVGGKKFDVVVATQDYHVPHHHSFASNNPGKHLEQKIDLHYEQQFLWPDHCVQNTPGASFHPALEVHLINFVVKKGMNPMFDTASAFFDKKRGEVTQLNEYLKFKKVSEVIVLGIALDLGITQTALDAAELGYQVTLLKDLIPNYKLTAEREKFRWDELSQKKVKISSSDQV